ncbi:MAG: DUF397 domain-containing protein [Streptosporangiaceae bacterium]
MNLADAVWRKSVHSGATSDCVEVADNLRDVCGVRDSKDRQGPALVFTRDEWSTFVTGVKNGSFDR